MTMKDVTQVKTELVEHQHDALLQFYKDYPRLYVSTVLLRLGESCLPSYPPTLAQFVTTPAQQGAEKRAVVIRIKRDEYPGLWAFYNDLPYGARTTVLINVLNWYATIAESDKTLLEKAYWRRGDSANTSQAAVQVDGTAVNGGKQDAIATATEVAARPVLVEATRNAHQEQQPVSEKAADPLKGRQVGL